MLWTRLPELLLNVIKPYNLPVPMLASIIIFAAAFPTAFTGASGIFILAVGGVVYDELRRAGAGRQLALATTAMSGSLGVVLNPCLLITVAVKITSPAYKRSGVTVIGMVMAPLRPFRHRYERLLLPIAVMGPTLLLVAFVPMIFYAI